MADTRHQGSKSRSLSNPITTLQDFLFSACLFIQSAIQSAGRQDDGSLLCLFEKYRHPRYQNMVHTRKKPRPDWSTLSKENDIETGRVKIKSDKPDSLFFCIVNATLKSPRRKQLLFHSD